MKSTVYTINGNLKEQKMSGFGVNINSKYWGNGKLLPVMEFLVDDLGAVLYRVDVYGKSNWIDETGRLGKEKALSRENLDYVYTNPVSQSGWAMMRYLNEKGIEPYITCSGDVPRWMLGGDGATLTDYESFCEMLISFIDWARNKEKIRFSLFGPLNETDLGSPEGPALDPSGYVKICEMLDCMLKEKGWDDIKFVVAEQASFNPDYIKAFSSCESLASRVAVFGMHMYGEIPKEQFDDVRESISEPYKDKLLWMSEYGDLDQTGEKEWYVAWKSAERAIAFMNAGFNGGMQWDAFDNFHDHDGAWTIYGLIRYARHVATPKKRYYGARQLYRFIKPGFFKVSATGGQEECQIAAFISHDEKDVTIAGMNHSSAPCELCLRFVNLPLILSRSGLNLYVTTEKDNCVRHPETSFYSKFGGADVAKGNSVTVCVPPESIFTLTTLI